jgi:hypothetical protein
MSLMMRLDDFRLSFSRCLQIEDVYKRDITLASLMTEMEQTFQIPMMYYEAFEKVNPDVMHLYRQISYAREL